MSLSNKLKHGLPYIVIIGYGLTILLVAVMRGFTFLNVDAHVRSLLASGWAQTPYFFGDDPVWLPAHTYILGVGLMIYDDLIITPQVITMGFSLICLVCLYFLAIQLFNHGVGLITVLWVGTLNFFVYLSLTPMSEIPYFVFLFGFFTFFLRWYDHRRDRDLLVASGLLMVATGMRYEAWITAFAFGVYLAYQWLRGLWQEKKVNWPGLVAMTVLAIYPAGWMIRAYLRWNDPIYFLRWYTPLPETQSVSPSTSNLQAWWPYLGLMGLMGTTMRDRLVNWVRAYQRWLGVSAGLIGIAFFIRYQRGAAPVYLDLLITHGGPILFLAVFGLIGIWRDHPHSRQKVYLYLLFGGLPLVVMGLIQQYVGVAYLPRFVSQYIILLTPFAASVVYHLGAKVCVSGERINQTTSHWVQQDGVILIILGSYSLWTVALRAVDRDSIFLVGAIWLVGVGLIIKLLSGRYRFLALVSYLPLPFLAYSIKGLAQTQQGFIVWSSYLLGMVILWGWYFWKRKQILVQSSHTRQPLLALGLGLAIWLWAIWNTLYQSPEFRDNIAVGLALREAFMSEQLDHTDKIFIDISAPHLQYASILALSNHPEQFILDRDPHSLIRSVPNQNSFIQDHHILPYQNSIARKATPWPNNPLQSQSITQFFEENNIRVMVLYDPVLKYYLESTFTLDKMVPFEKHTIYFLKDDP